MSSDTSILTVLTIAGSDSSGGAGLQMDLKVFAALGVYGVSAVTSVTAQSTTGIHRIHHLPPNTVAAQIDAVARDMTPDAVKIGMLGRAQAVRVVADRIRRRDLVNVVLDPVLAAKDGTSLLNASGIKALKEDLLPLCRVVTPNVPEAERLSGVEIRDEESLEEAARRIAAHRKDGGLAVVIKGGHRPALSREDVVLNDGVLTRIGGVRIEGPAVHGTGCMYSAALAARLAHEDTVTQACERARGLVEEAIRGAVKLGRGARVALPAVKPVFVRTR